MTDTNIIDFKKPYKRFIELREEYKSIFYSGDSRHYLKIRDTIEKDRDARRAERSAIFQEEKVAIRELYNDFPSAEVNKIIDNKSIHAFLRKHRNTKNTALSYRHLEYITNKKRDNNEASKDLFRKLESYQRQYYNWKRNVKD
ncbi:MAG: hypothetical protein ISQ21_10195 [Alphaproteobacteria bacterium]|nr:hypothetical protein [Alphaproteobacteria bacterium]